MYRQRQFSCLSGAPTEPIVVKAAPPAEVSLPIERIVVAPTVPACVAIEKKLRIGQDAAVQTLSKIAAAKRAALAELYQSPDYIAAKADKADKNQAKQTVADNLQKDRTAGADTDHDLADMQATSAAWVVSSGTLSPKWKMMPSRQMIRSKAANPKPHTSKPRSPR